MGWVTNLMDSVAAMFISDIAEIRMFPDGNSSVARLMIQQLIPSIAPGMKGFEDVAVTRFDYGALDRADANIRMRLSSTVVGVRENRNQKTVCLICNDCENTRTILCSEVSDWFDEI